MKRDKILYWVFTGLISLAFAASGFMYLSNPVMTETFKQIGYPSYFVPILGIAKIAGALALINPWFPKLREWAYAGFTFTLIGAIWTHVATHSPFAAPLIFLLVLAVSYLFYQRLRGKQVGTPALS